MVDENDEDLSPQKPGTIWFAVYVTEFVVIFTINAFTIIAFSRNHHLRKRTTYLIINLTVADLLVGAVTGPLSAFYIKTENGTGFSWREFFTRTVGFTFPLASQINLSLISLERLHATLYPFRHCLIEKLLYFKIIIGSWLVVLLLSFVMVGLELYVIRQPYTMTSFTFLTLLIITISYVIITVNVKKTPLPQHLGSVVSDRKLSVTLFMVTVASILTILPLAICNTIPDDTWFHLFTDPNNHITEAVTALYYANSIVNPLIYAIRMREFRKAVKELIVGKTPESRRVQPIEPLGMQRMNSN